MWHGIYAPPPLRANTVKQKFETTSYSKIFIFTVNELAARTKVRKEGSQKEIEYSMDGPFSYNTC